ncbi:MAG: glutamate racemase [Candidatus Atribacteria bacterium]|nr:glutamate racemase [Candidatus Atribacteria bacterium]MCD6349497.1 glutamate racemase [Candidatus Atribacteria bacterium]
MKMLTSYPLGIIDSGVGGLSVVKAVQKIFPNQNVVYVADPANFPYGEKTKEELLNLVFPIIEYLLKVERVRALVIACGTLSSVCFEELCKTYPIPIFDVVKPAVREAVSSTLKKRVGVLATSTTVRSKRFTKLFKELDSRIEVYEEAWSDFIEEVERGNFNTLYWQEEIKARLKRFKSSGVDTLILGCTHFALIEDFFKGLLGNSSELVLINPARACTPELQKVFGIGNNAKDNSKKGEVRCLIRGDVRHFERLLRMFASENSFKMEAFGS